MNSPLTREQWQLLETHAETAHQAMQTLMLELFSMAAKCDDEKLKGKLLAEAKRVGDAQFLPGYYYHIQPEWAGGDSMNPKNTVYREPHFSGERRAVV